MGADPRSPAEAGPGGTGSVGPGTCEQALEQERAANRDLVRKCAELDEVISGSQSLVRELRRDRDRLRRELVAAEDAALRADEAGRQADAELRRLRRELEKAAEELGRHGGPAAGAAPGKGSPSARGALREIRGRFAKGYHPDLVTDPGEKSVRERVFKHVWTVFDEIEAQL
jgi:hypothetical protein